MDMSDTLDRIKLQNAEFDALLSLSAAHEALCRTAVVDDDYPEVRHRYEGELRAFLQACADNQRPMPSGRMPDGGEQ